MTDTEQVAKGDNKSDSKVNENGYFSEEDLHILEIKDPNNSHKCTSISGLCVSCDRNTDCDFIRGFAILLKDNMAKPVADCELAIYSCDDYPVKGNDCVYCNYPKKVQTNEVNACQ